MQRLRAAPWTNGPGCGSNGPPGSVGRLRDHGPVATGSIEALIDEGHGAFERGDADASRRAFEAALAESAGGELFEGFARALYLAGDYRGSIEAHERGFAA